MIGTIIGDIIGSRFLVNNSLTKDFVLFTSQSHFTINTIVTLAIAKAIMNTWHETKTHPVNSNKPIQSPLDNPSFFRDLANKVKVIYKDFRNRYNFTSEITTFDLTSCEHPHPNDVAASLVSPVAYIARNEKELLKLANIIAKALNDDYHFIKDVEVSAMIVFLALEGHTQEKIFNRMRNNISYIDFSLYENKSIRKFNHDFHNVVSQAILAFKESNSFTDAIRNTISIGGPSNTLGAMVGSIAGSYFSIPLNFEKAAFEYLDPELKELFSEWNNFLDEKANYHIYETGLVFQETRQLRTHLKSHSLKSFELEIIQYYPKAAGLTGYSTEYCMVNQETNNIFVKRRGFFNEVINLEYQISAGVDHILEALEELLNSEGWMTLPTRSNVLFRPYFSLTLFYQNGTTRHIKGVLKRSKMPTQKWNDFVTLLFPFSILLGETKRPINKVTIQETATNKDLICYVKFQNDRTYLYKANFQKVLIGEHVLVPIGHFGEVRVGIVKAISPFHAKDKSFPVKNIRPIIKALKDYDVEKDDEFFTYSFIHPYYAQNDYYYELDDVEDYDDDFESTFYIDEFDRDIDFESDYD